MDKQDKHHSIAESIAWKLTAYELVQLKAGEDRARQPDLSPHEFYEALEFMDETGSVIKRLDANVLESIAPEDMNQFLDGYAVVCITAMARKSNLIDTLVKFQLIAFQNPDEFGDMPAMADYPRLASVLAPIKGEYPYFCNHFLGILQSRLEKTLGNARFLPPKRAGDILTDDKGATAFPDGSKAAFERRINLAKNFLAPRKLMTETRTAMTSYFENELKQEHGIVIKAFADLSVPHVFLWLLFMDIMDEIIDDLLIGKPMFQRVIVDGQEDYIPTKEGRDTPLSAITGEDG